MTISRGHIHTGNHSTVALTIRSAFPSASPLSPRCRCSAADISVAQGDGNDSGRGDQRVECGAQSRRSVPGDRGELR